MAPAEQNLNREKSPNVETLAILARSSQFMCKAVDPTVNNNMSSASSHSGPCVTRMKFDDSHGKMRRRFVLMQFAFVHFIRF